MKVHVSIFLSFFFVYFLFSCSSDDEKETTLVLSNSEFLFSADESTKLLDITSNESWLISGIPDWISVSKENGEGSSQISFTVSSNPKEEERFATLSITAKDKSVEVKIQQVAKNVTLSVSKEELSFEAEPQQDGQSFDIISNEKWVVVDYPDWCTFSSIEGNGDATITIIADKNYIDKERVGEFKIKAGSKEKIIKLRQEPLSIQLNFTNEDFTGWGSVESFIFENSGGTNSVIVGSNTKWEVRSSNPEWCTIDKSSGENNESIAIKVIDNKEKKTRSASITISAGSQNIKVWVSQKRFIEVDESNPYQLNERDNMPLVGDRLVMKQIDYVDPGAGGENVTWNFSKLNVINDDYVVAYDSPPMDEKGNIYQGYDVFNVKNTDVTNLFTCTEHNTMYFFKVNNNILEALGHENPTIKLKYSPRMISGAFPMYFNDSYKVDYKTTALYSSTVDMASVGKSEIKIDGYGDIYLPSGLYKNVVRTKFTQTIKDVSSYADKTRKGTEMIIYKWYVKGYRYPVLEIYSMFDFDENKVTFMTGFYYSPTDQSSLNNKTKKTVIGSIPLNKSLKSNLPSMYDLTPIVSVKNK